MEILATKKCNSDGVIIDSTTTFFLNDLPERQLEEGEFPLLIFRDVYLYVRSIDLRTEMPEKIKKTNKKQHFFLTLNTHPDHKLHILHPVIFFSESPINYLLKLPLIEEDRSAIHSEK